MSNTRYKKGDPFPQCRNCGRDLEHFPGQWLRSTCGADCEEEFYSWDRHRAAPRDLAPDIADMTLGPLRDDGTRDPRGAYGYTFKHRDYSNLDAKTRARFKAADAAEDAAWTALTKINREQQLWRETIIALTASAQPLRTEELNRIVGRDPAELARVRKRMAEAGAIVIEGTRRTAIVRLQPDAEAIRKREYGIALDRWEATHCADLPEEPTVTKL